MLSKGLTEQSNNLFFDHTNTPNRKASFGHIVFAPNERIPKEGYATHDDDEYSFIVSGEACCVIDGVEHVATAGTAMFIPAGEAHYTCNNSNEPFEVVYTLVKR